MKNTNKTKEKILDDEIIILAIKNGVKGLHNALLKEMIEEKKVSLTSEEIDKVVTRYFNKL